MINWFLVYFIIKFALSTSSRFRFKEIKMQHVVWEVIAYIIFLYLMMMIAYSSRDLLFYRLYDHYSKMFLKGSMDGTKPSNFWDLHKVSLIFLCSQWLQKFPSFKK